MVEPVEPSAAPILEAPLPPAPPPVVLRTEGLTRAFGKVRAVDGVGLELRRGEIYGFLGRNGAGKTTTLKLLCGLLKPDAGRIELLGKSHKKMGARERAHLGYVSQEQSFYPWMTATQLGRFVQGFYPSFREETFAALLRQLEIPVDRKAAQLSGGTRTKLGIALALAHKPEVLLLDEPTAGLDPVMRVEVHELLASHARQEQQTILLSSHLVSELEPLADRVGILHGGRLQWQGTQAELGASVRKVLSAPELPPALPTGARLLREEPPGADGRRAQIVLAAPEAWGAHDPSGMELQSLSLSEIFLAFARGPVAG